MWKYLKNLQILKNVSSHSLSDVLAAILASKLNKSLIDLCMTEFSVIIAKKYLCNVKRRDKRLFEILQFLQSKNFDKVVILDINLTIFASLTTLYKDIRHQLYWLINSHNLFFIGWLSIYYSHPVNGFLHSVPPDLYIVDQRLLLTMITNMILWFGIL